MTSETQGTTAAPALPLLELDLGVNGGLLAPTTVQELVDWVQNEYQFWSWFANNNLPGGGPRNAVNAALQPMRDAVNQVQNAVNNQKNPNAFTEHLRAARTSLERAYVINGIPHSSTPLAKRVAQLSGSKPAAAQAYLFVYVPQGGHRFDTHDIESWQGFLQALSERYGVASTSHQSFESVAESLGDLRGKTEQLLGEKKASLDDLHRQFEALALSIGEQAGQQKTGFDRFIEANQSAHDEAINNHKNAMERLEKTFREKMSLRAPVDYWESRKAHHEKWSGRASVWMFVLMAVLGLVIGGAAYWTFVHLGSNDKPDLWRVAVLVLVGVLGMWAIRLVVRMYLSHAHLATDAAERVTMVKTYLSLLEAEKLPSDDDRKLILQALFRPASDGIVKDESLPHPLIEALTRVGRP